MAAVVASETGDWRRVLSLGPSPACPEPEEGELQVRVLSCGLAFPDVLVVEGKHIQKGTPPFVPGSKCPGSSSRWGQGDRLRVAIAFWTTSCGGLREKTIVPAAGAYILPKGVDVNIGRFELNYGTTFHGLVDIARLKRGKRCR